MHKVFQVVQHLRPGGLENMVLDIQQFSLFNDNTWVISLEGDKESALRHWPKLKAVEDRLIFLNKQEGLSIGLLSELKQFFEREQPDVIHTHHVGPLLYAGFAARLAGVKAIIHTEHDAWHLAARKRRMLQKLALKLARPIVVADGSAVAQSLQLNLGLEQVKTIHNGIDTNRFCPGSKAEARQKLSLPQNVRLVGCSGRMEAVKNHEMLIGAIGYLDEDIHLVLAGDGSCMPQLQYRTLVEGLGHRVHFLGHTDDMPVFYQALDLFCLPSLCEGFPLAPLEAQACNIPAIVTDVGCCKDTLCPNSGRLLENHHAKDAANAIADMLNSRLEANPRQFITRHFDVRTMAKAYDDLCHLELNGQVALVEDSK